MGAADAAVGFFRASVDGAELLDELLLSGIGPTGSPAISAEFLAQGIEFTVYYAIDTDPAGNAVMSGNLIFLNTTTEPIEVVAEFLLPICPHVQFLPSPAIAPKIGGVASIRINADADGGAITCHSENSELSVVLGTDGESVHQPFYCPFELKLTGAGTAVTNGFFGLPAPSMPIGKPFHDMGHRVAFSLTPGDKATFALFYALAGIHDPLETPSCPADINGDGVVDAADLALVLAYFATVAECGSREEINRDGLIDGADLALVLAAWGPCPENGA